jgi:hypothetical protein
METPVTPMEFARRARLVYGDREAVREAVDRVGDQLPHVTHFVALEGSRDGWIPNEAVVLVGRWLGWF